jgi:hypothetical protein
MKLEIKLNNIPATGGKYYGDGRYLTSIGHDKYALGYRYEVCACPGGKYEHQQCHRYGYSKFSPHFPFSDTPRPSRSTRCVSERKWVMTRPRRSEDMGRAHRLLGVVDYFESERREAEDEL